VQRSLLQGLPTFLVRYQGSFAMNHFLCSSAQEIYLFDGSLDELHPCPARFYH
jgi:hypothetical protein